MEKGYSRLIPNLRRAWKFAQSRRLAIWLLVFFGTLLALSRFNLLPESLLKKVGLKNIYSSWLFIGLCATLFVNTAACTIQRIINLLATRGRKLDLKLSDLRSSKTYFKIVGGGDEVFAKLSGFLKKRGYRALPVDSADGVGIMASRGRIAKWSGPLFHLALLLIFLGGVVTGLTRFSGIIELTEGQSTVEEKEGYVRIFEQGPLFKDEDHHGFSLKLDKYKPVYLSDGKPKNFYSVLSLSDGWENRQIKIHVSKPGTYRGLTIYDNQINGISALLTVADERGSPINSSHVLFDKPKKVGKPLTGKYEAKESGVSIQGKLYPDFGWSKASGSSVWEIRKPVLSVKVYSEQPVIARSPSTGLRAGSATKQSRGRLPRALSSPRNDRRGERKLIYKGHLALGQVAKFNTAFGKLQLKFEDAKYWSSYNVVKDRGRPIIFTGFWLGLLSLGLLSFLNEKRLSIIIEEGRGKREEGNLRDITIHMAGWSDKYKASFLEEMEIISGEIEKELGA